MYRYPELGKWVLMAYSVPSGANARPLTSTAAGLMSRRAPAVGTPVSGSIVMSRKLDLDAEKSVPAESMASELVLV